MENRKRKIFFRHTGIAALISLFLLLPVHGTAQITTDYNTCLQGVKDSSGKWKIEPKYEDMRYDEYGYIVSIGGKYGLIDRQGKERIPIIYHSINSLFDWEWQNILPGYYRVSNNGLRGVVDTSNKVIVPLIYARVLGARDSTILAMQGKDTWYFYPHAGGLFASPWHSKTAPAPIGQHRYMFKHEGIFGKKYGVVSDSGKIILPMKFDYIESYWETDVMRVRKKDHYGFCSMDGEFSWPMNLGYIKNQYAYSSYYSSDLQYLGRNGTGPACNGKKYGLVNLKGDTLLPFEYDNITAFNGTVMKGTGNLWTVDKDSLSGIYNDESGWVIPIGCRLLISLETFYATDDSAAVGLMAYLINGKWGVKTTSGQEILPCVYDEFCTTSDADYIFRKGDSLMLMGINSSANLYSLIGRVTGYPVFTSYRSGYSLVTKIPADERFAVFKGKENTTAYYNPALTHDSVEWKREMLALDKGENYCFSLPDSIIHSCAFYTQRLTQPVVSAAGMKAYHIDHLFLRDSAGTSPQVVYFPGQKFHLTGISSHLEKPGPDYYSTYTSTVFNEEGRIIISGDTTQRIYMRRRMADGSIYLHGVGRTRSTVYDTLGNIEISIDKGTLSEPGKNYYWKYLGKKHKRGFFLCDRRTGESVLPRKEYSEEEAPIWDSITIIQSKETGIRLYNANSKKFLTSAGFDRISPLTKNGSAFAVKTCAGHMGIIAANGTWISDTAWNCYTPALVDTLYPDAQDGSDYEHPFYELLVFSNATSASVFDSRDERMHPMNSYYDVLWNYLACPLFTDSLEKAVLDTAYTYADTILTHFYFRSADSAQFLSWHKRCLADSILAPRRTLDNIEYYMFPHCAWCHKQKAAFQQFGWTKNYDRSGAFIPVLVRDSVFSFCRANSAYSYPHSYLEKYWCSNVVLFPDGPRQFIIDSLFNPQSDWRNFLVNTVLDFVNTHKNVDGDCHNPAGIPLSLRESFLITREGIQLFPPGFTYNDEQLMILVTWKEMDPYLRNDLRTKLPVNEK